MFENMPEENFFVEVSGNKNRKGKHLPGLVLGGIRRNVVLSSTDSQLQDIIPGDVIVKVERKRRGGFQRKSVEWDDVDPGQNIEKTIEQSGGVIRMTLLRPDPFPVFDTASVCRDFGDRHDLKWKNNQLVNSSDDSPFNYDRFSGDRTANDRRYEDICESHQGFPLLESKIEDHPLLGAGSCSRNEDPGLFSALRLSWTELSRGVRAASPPKAAVDIASGEETLEEEEEGEERVPFTLRQPLSASSSTYSFDSETNRPGPSTIENRLRNNSKKMPRKPGRHSKTAKITAADNDSNLTNAAARQHSNYDLMNSGTPNLTGISATTTQSRPPTGENNNSNNNRTIANPEGLRSTQPASTSGRGSSERPSEDDDEDNADNKEEKEYQKHPNSPPSVSSDNSTTEKSHSKISRHKNGGQTDSGSDNSKEKDIRPKKSAPTIRSGAHVMPSTEIPDTNAEASSSSFAAAPPGYLSGPEDSVETVEFAGEILPSVTVVGPARSRSAQSNASSTTSSIVGDICRICHCEGTLDIPLITPCYCAGSLKFVHQKCLQQWIKSSQTRSCEVCRYSFHMQTKLKPFTKWEKLDISSVERRKILCSVTFHVIAITCVVWSLYVLIDRTAEEISNGELDWPFWTKLVVVAIGFTGGVVFMYVQCKMYVQLFRRWKAYNKVIYVQDCPEGLHEKKKKGTLSGLHGSPHVIIEMKPHRTVAITSAPPTH